MGDGRGVESKKTCLPLHHPAAHRWNKGCHLANSIRWVSYLVRSVLWITLSSIAFYRLSTLFDLEVITKLTNGLAKHNSPTRQYGRSLQCLKHVGFIVQLPLRHQYCFCSENVQSLLLVPGKNLIGSYKRCRNLSWQHLWRDVLTPCTASELGA